MMNKKEKAGSEAPRSNGVLGSGEGDIEGQMEALAGTFKQYSQQNRKLAGLYELAKLRNQELRLAGCRINRDIAFLREYCQTLEHQLALRGYYKHQHSDMLSRKETAQGIFLTYSRAQLQEDESVDEEQEESLLFTPPRILNQRLQPKLLSKSTQADPEPLHWRSACERAEARVEVLERQVRELREANDKLEWQRQKRGAASFVLQDRSKIFGNIHALIGEYKRKINLLAHEKKEVERKYKQLKEKVSRLDDTTEYRMIELYSEKIEVLQKLTEKQQAEIENTIELYQVELSKIEERRREEIQFFENERLDLETQNLRLCIDLQKSLNGKDQVALQLMQEKNKNQILLQEIIQLKEAIEQYRKRQAHRKDLAIISCNLTLRIEPQRSPPIPHKRGAYSQSQAYLLHSDSENSNTENLDCQSSEMSEKRELIERLEDVTIKRENSIKKPIRDKITITYGQPYMLKPHYTPHLHPPIKTQTFNNVNKSYDSVLQYKKRFIERKPESSLNL